MVVAGGGLDLEDAVADLEHGHVEGAAAEVEDEDRLVGLLVEPVRERGGGRLVDDALDVEAGDLAGVLGGLALVVVEVRGDGDHRASRRPRRDTLRRPTSASAGSSREISGGECCSPPASTRASPLGPATTL